jgi:hypothetical protein
MGVDLSSSILWPAALFSPLNGGFSYGSETLGAEG